jgi:hypothetical protein
LIFCAAILLVTTQGALAAPDSAGAGAPVGPAYGASPFLVLAQANLSSRSNIRPLPAGSGIAPDARIQSLKPRATGPARDISRPTRKVAPGIGNSRFSIDRRRIDNRGLNAGTTDGLKQQVQKRLGKQRLRTTTPDKEIVRRRQAAPSRLTKTKEQGSQPAKGAVKAAVPKTAGKGGLQTPAADSAGSRKIPHHTPEWTNLADSDPGATGASPGVYAVWLTTGLADGPQPGSSAGWTHTRGWPVKWNGPEQKANGAAAAGTVKPFNATKGFGFIEPGDGSTGGAAAQTAGTATGHVLSMPHDHQPPTASVDGQRLEFLRLLTVPVQPAQPPFGTGLRQLEFAANSPAQGGGEVARKDTSTFKKTTGDDATGDASVGSTPSGAAATGTIRGYDRTHRVTAGPTHAPTVGAGMTAGAGTASADSPDRPVLTGRVYNAEGNAGQAAGGSSWLPEVGDEVLTGFEAGAAPGSDPSGYVGVRQQQGRVATDQDYNAARPGSAASGLPTGKRQHKPFSVTRPTDGETSSAAELYDYPGDYAQRFDGVEPSQSPAGDVATEQVSIVWEGIDRSRAGHHDLAGTTGLRATGKQSAIGGPDLVVVADPFPPTDPPSEGSPSRNGRPDVIILDEPVDGPRASGHGSAPHNEIRLEDTRGGASADSGDGGRHTPFFTNYRPQFYFRATDAPTGGEQGDVTRPYVIGSLFNDEDAGSRGHQSLYFPEQMLQEIGEPAGAGHRYPGQHVQRFDDISPDLPRVVVRGWDPVKKATVESQRFSGQYTMSGVIHQSADAAGPVPVPYPTVAEAAVTADAAGRVGKPLLVIAEDVEGESRATYGPWAYFRWSR